MAQSQQPTKTQIVDQYGNPYINSTAIGVTASGSTDTGTPPVKVGGVYRATAPTYSDGQAAEARYGARGEVIASIANGTAVAAVGTVSDTVSVGTRNYLFTAGTSLVFDGSGTNYALLRSALGAKNTDGSKGTAVSDFLWSASDALSTTVNVAVSGDTAILAAVSGQTHRIHALEITAASAVKLILKDGSTGKRAYNLVAGVPIIIPFRGRPLFKGTANTALVANLSSAVSIDINIDYLTSA